MNVYELGICEHCGEMTVAAPSMIVHGAKNLRKAREMAKEGKTFDEIRATFCQWCGNEKPCNCEVSKKNE